MVDQQQPLRVSGPIRILGTLLLVLGIVAMHAGVFAQHTEARHGAPALIGAQAMLSDHHESIMTGSADDTGTVEHSVIHPCVFILSVIALAIAFVLLYSSGDDTVDSRLPTSPHWRLHRERPPPWTAPTLAELSMLRI